MVKIQALNMPLATIHLTDLNLLAEPTPKIAHNVRLLRQYGNMLSLPHSKALGGGLYELRIRGQEELRVFYCFVKQKTIYLLHAFKKQKQQTPQKDLDLALSRMKEVDKIITSML